MSLRKISGLLAFFVLSSTSLSLASGYDIRTYDWRKYFNQIYSDCLQYERFQDEAVHIASIQYHDFDSDGNEEALITAGSCNSGTGGPDIHTVFRLNDRGAAEEIPITASTEGVRIFGTPLPLVGNRNWVMAVNGDLLCEIYHDGSGRKTPMTKCYKLAGDKFVLSSVTYAPTFTTSFDCRRAKTDREIVVCGNENLAKLDLDLNEVFQEALRRSPKDKRRGLIAHQQQWLKDIDKWSAYKWCCDGIERSYRQRIRELKSY